MWEWTHDLNHASHPCPCSLAVTLGKEAFSAELAKLVEPKPETSRGGLLLSHGSQGVHYLRLKLAQEESQELKRQRNDASFKQLDPASHSSQNLPMLFSYMNQNVLLRFIPCNCEDPESHIVHVPCIMMASMALMCDWFSVASRPEWSSVTYGARLNEVNSLLLGVSLSFPRHLGEHLLVCCSCLLYFYLWKSDLL